MSTVTKSNDDNVLKYLQVLKDLKMILDHTPHLSMTSFCEKHKVEKTLTPVLHKGGVIKLIEKGKYPMWKWVSIAPNKHVAVEVLKKLNEMKPKNSGTINTKETKNKRNTTTAKAIEFYELKCLFGLIRIRIKPHYTE